MDAVEKAAMGHTDVKDPFVQEIMTLYNSYGENALMNTSALRRLIRRMMKKSRPLEILTVQDDTVVFALQRIVPVYSLAMKQVSILSIIYGMSTSAVDTPANEMVSLCRRLMIWIYFTCTRNTLK